MQTQGGEAAAGLALYRSGGAAQRLSDFVDWQVLDVAQHDDGALPRRQAQQRRLGPVVPRRLLHN